MKSHPIRPIPPGAHEALGGEPMLPPALPTQPVAACLPDQEPTAGPPASIGLPTQPVGPCVRRIPAPTPPAAPPAAAPAPKRRKPAAAPPQPPAEPAADPSDPPDPSDLPIQNP